MRYKARRRRGIKKRIQRDSIAQNQKSNFAKGKIAFLSLLSEIRAKMLSFFICFSLQNQTTPKDNDSFCLKGQRRLHQLFV